MIASRHGYSIHSAVFPRARMIAIGDVIDRAPLERTKAGARHVLKVPELAELAAVPMMLAIARSYVGPTALPFRATLFDKSLSANWLVAWHQDTALPLQRRVEAPGWGPWTIKGGVLHAIAPVSALEQIVALRVHIDDSTPDNGPLRVLPGTHTCGVLPDAEITALANQIDPAVCVVDAGGVIAMRPLIVHASSKARSAQPRRVIHFEYASSVDIGGGLELRRCDLMI